MSSSWRSPKRRRDAASHRGLDISLTVALQRKRKLRRTGRHAIPSPRIVAAHRRCQLRVGACASLGGMSVGAMDYVAGIWRLVRSVGVQEQRRGPEAQHRTTERPVQAK